MKHIALAVCMSISFQLEAQLHNGWTIFARVKFNSRYFKEFDQHFLVPSFDSNTRALEGSTVSIRGHYMPIDLDNSRAIVLSKYPYSQCFFCGGAGPESVVEIIFSSKHPKLKTDQIITVHGKLRLNDKDINHLNFILDHAELQ
jgi:hypothetical protein